MSKRGFPRERLAKFAAKVIRRARMIIESPRTIDGRIVKRVATGELSKSLSYKIAQGRVLKFTSAKQGYWVEYGRKPSAKFPPLEAMRQWVRVKRIKPRDKNGRFIRMTEANLNSIAYLAARKVKEKGYKGIRFYNTAIQRELAKPNNDLQDATRIMVRDELARRLKITITSTK